MEVNYKNLFKTCALLIQKYHKRYLRILGLYELLKKTAIEFHFHLLFKREMLALLGWINISFISATFYHSAH